MPSEPNIDPNIPPPLTAVPPPLPAETAAPLSFAPGWLVTILSASLGLFLIDAAFSLADDSLGLFFNFHFLNGVRALLGFFAAIAALVLYVLMAFVPAIPKRYFMPLALYNLLAAMVGIPFLIYFYQRMMLIDWCISVSQVCFGLWLLRQLHGAFNWRWPWVAPDRLRSRRFGWKYFAGFGLANVFVLLPAIVLYFFFCASLALGHFSEGFMSLRPGGLNVQVRTYVRDDGKTIRLFPMSHVADGDFYQKVSQSFPSNSVILMEGVTDEHDLITNKISYARMAKSLGLAEQHEKFVPVQGEWVRADVDVSVFSKDTLDLLNLVMLIHSQGVNAGNLSTLLAFSPSPQIQDELIGDLLLKRNQHLLEQVQAYLPKTDQIMLPWGAAHMPGLSHGIEKAGFHLVKSQDYRVIRFHF